MDFERLIGIGLRHPHYQEVFTTPPPIGWYEVHSENFFQAGGITPALLSRIAERYPISLHGVGLSLGSADGLDIPHLKQLKQLIQRIQPCMVSEHLSWGKIAGVYLPDLLPIPYTDESLKIFSENVSIAQDFLNCQLLIENPSSYLEYTQSKWHEADFIVEVCRKSGCQLLLDINNVFVSCHNHDWNMHDYLEKIPKHLVKEIHLAGHSQKTLSNGRIIRVDTHDQRVDNEVWQLYAVAIKRFGPQMTLLERDGNIPSLAELSSEACLALNYLKEIADYA